MKKTKAAFLLATQILAEQPLYMWGLTFMEVLDIKDTRKRWNHLLTLIKRQWPELCGLRVFEMHKMHGLHVHLLTNRFIDVNVMRALAKKAGWGRINVKRIPAERAAYLAKYLSKDRAECLKSWRLWAGFGPWDWTKVKDAVSDSPFSRIYRACQEWLHWTGNKEFFARTRFVAFMELQTIINGWEPGLGPGGKPYWMCSKEELMGAKSK